MILLSYSDLTNANFDGAYFAADAKVMMYENVLSYAPPASRVPRNALLDAA